MLWGLLMWKWGAVGRGEIRLNRAWGRRLPKDVPGGTLKPLSFFYGCCPLPPPPHRGSLGCFLSGGARAPIAGLPDRAKQGPGRIMFSLGKIQYVTKGTLRMVPILPASVDPDMPCRETG